jgi:hypothetical protein
MIRTWLNPWCAAGSDGGNKPMRVSRHLLAGAVALLFLAALTGRAEADTISLGQMSFDQFIASDGVFVGTNMFTIYNATGDFAGPPDPALPPNPITPVSLLDANLRLTESNGDVINIALGTIGPGLFDDGTLDPPFALQTADTRMFTSAVFTASLGDVLSFLLADGSSFQAATANLSFALTGAGGGFLVPNPIGGDALTLVPFEISGTIVPPTTNVPEPATGVLLGAALAGICAFGRRRAQGASNL